MVSGRFNVTSFNQGLCFQNERGKGVNKDTTKQNKAKQNSAYTGVGPGKREPARATGKH